MRFLSSFTNKLCADDGVFTVAEDVEGEALATLVVNKLRNSLKVAAVKAPGFGDNRKANLQDLAVLTGGTLISEDVGLSLDKVTLDMLGTCGKVSHSDSCLLRGGGNVKGVDRSPSRRMTPLSWMAPATRPSWRSDAS